MRKLTACRRRFLQMAALGAGAAACGPVVRHAPAIGDIPAGNVSSLPVGALTRVGSEPLALGRDGGGVYAMTLECTHDGCESSVRNQEIVCPCHGSTFDADGNVIAGPAPAPLDHYAVTADGSGNLTIHTGTVVDSATRLQV
jgi:cytochrome b6-f complex iron-sulfur subunit